MERLGSMFGSVGCQVVLWDCSWSFYSFLDSPSFLPLPNFTSLWMPSVRNITPKGAKQAKIKPANMNFSIGFWNSLILAPILIHTKVQSTGPASLTNNMKSTATTKRALQTQYITQMKLSQHEPFPSSFLSSFSPYFSSLGFDYFSSLLLAYFFQFCRSYRQLMEGTKTKQRTMKLRYRQTMASTNPGCFITSGTGKISLTPERRHNWMIPTSPKPKPQRIGPNSNIRITFQQLLLESAMLPVRQMKQRMVQIGYKIEMRYAAPCTFLQQTSEQLEVKTQQIRIEQYISVNPRAVKIMMGQEGLKLVEMRRYYLKEMARRSAMQESGAFTPRLISLSIIL